VAAWLRGRGFAVRALHRSTSDTRYLRELGCELVQGEVGGDAGAEGTVAADVTMARLADGCDALVHSAAVLYSGLPWEEVRRRNVEGSMRIFQAAASAGIRSAVHLSTVAVYGAVSGPVQERDPLQGVLGRHEFYARSKREAEDAVVGASEGSGMAVTLLRPSAVYGERDRLFTPNLLRLLRRPIHPMPGGGRTSLPLIYAGNLADAVGCALKGGAPPGIRVYNVAEDHPVTQRMLWAAMAEAHGVPFRPLTLPGPIVFGAARLAEALGIRVPGAGELSLGRVARLALRPNPYRSERIREELGWTPPVPLEEAVRRTVRWFDDSDVPESGEER